MYSDSLDPAFSIDGVTAYHGPAIDVLAALPEQSVSCVVTSPPYWAKRCYEGEHTIWGGDSDCQHEWLIPTVHGRLTGGGARPPDSKWKGGPEYDVPTTTTTCRLCGAWRGQYGLEPTPELYIEHSMLVLDALWRVLRDDGVVWWNVGDTRAGSGCVPGGNDRESSTGSRGTWHGGPESTEKRHHPPSGLKPKDLCLIPLRFVMAAQERGWYVRSDVIWQKPNVKPESVKDRPTDSYEYIFMLTKSERYWYDMFAVREPSVKYEKEGPRLRTKPDGCGFDEVKQAGAPDQCAVTSHRNLRDVWSLTTHPYPGAHFAPFPPELPRRCIEAGCPTEICLRCGRPRERIVEHQSANYTAHCPKDAALIDQGMYGRGGRLHGPGFRKEDPGHTETVGWTDCGCGAEFMPGIVLDPFAGTGTTGMAAREVGRDCILIEAAAEYIDQMQVRLTMGDSEVRRRVKAERESCHD